MTPATIVSRVVCASQAAADYRTCVEHDDPVVVRAMLCTHAFECAKRVIDRRATKFGPVAIAGTKASLCLVVEDRAVFVVVSLVTGDVSIVSDERRAA